MLIVLLYILFICECDQTQVTYFSETVSKEAGHPSCASSDDECGYIPATDGS